MDYSEKIDAETWAFIRRTEAFYPANAFEFSIKEQRRKYDAMCQEFVCARPKHVTVKDLSGNGVPLRGYSLNNPNQNTVILFSHGGSFSLGGIDSHDDICAEICDQTGFTVFAVDYRLIPENSFADAVDDVQSVFNWVCENGAERIILVGDSAGGYLSASIAHASRSTDKLIGQVLIYPCLCTPRNSGSMKIHAHAPLLTKAEVMKLDGIAADGAHCAPPNYVVPLLDGDFSWLPSTLAISAECDPIADDAKDYVEAILGAGGRAVWIEDKGLVHGHLRARHTVKRARASFDRVLKAINFIADGTKFSASDLKV